MRNTEELEGKRDGLIQGFFDHIAEKDIEEALKIEEKIYLLDWCIQ